MTRSAISPIIACLVILLLTPASHASFGLKWHSDGVLTTPDYSKSGLWSPNTNDIDGDGVSEIIVQKNNPDPWGYWIDVYDARTYALRWSSALFEGGNLDYCGFLDVDGDGTKEAVICHQGPLSVIDWITGVTEWTTDSVSVCGAYDGDGDGYDELFLWRAWRYLEIWGYIDGSSAVAGGGSSKPIGDPGVRIAPNPARSTITIAYDLEAPGQAQIEIYDVQGRAIRSFARIHQTAGSYSVEWDARSSTGVPVEEGVYSCRILVGGKTVCTKVVYVR